MEKVRTLDRQLHADLIRKRDYEELDRLIIAHLLGVSC